MDPEKDILRLVDDVFDAGAAPVPASGTDPQKPGPIESVPGALYPESILQTTDKANMYHTRFQSTVPQFIDTKTSIVRWKGSSIEELQRAVAEQLFIGPRANKKDRYGRHAATTLFSWSSSDEYIESRKRELRLKGKSVHERKQEEVVPETSGLVAQVGLRIPPQSVVTDLNSVVDREANVFIHDRIQVIKAHHSEQISKMINERKRKDHELHLQRVRQKEEQYERELRHATDDRDKSSGFFGSLFGGRDSPTVNSFSDKDKADKNKRFSFLPGSLFVSRPSPKPKNDDMAASASIDSSNSRPDSRPQTPVEPPHTPAPHTPAPHTPVQNTVPRTPASAQAIAASDLDLVFQAPKEDEEDEFDEFDDFTTAPPAPKPINRSFLPMQEAPPLINFDSEPPHSSNDDLLAL